MTTYRTIYRPADRDRVATLALNCSTKGDGGMMDKIEYPAVLVLSRWDHNLQRPITMLDGVVVHNDVELEERQNAYRMLEYLGGVPYIYTLAAVGTEHEIMKQRAEELWTQQTFGRRQVGNAAIDDDDAWMDHRMEQAERRAVMAGVA